VFFAFVIIIIIIKNVLSSALGNFAGVKLPVYASKSSVDILCEQHRLHQTSNAVHMSLQQEWPIVRCFE
jgi:hypothetical protein